MERELKHVAIIMDGNARWAKQNNKFKAEGHRQGGKVAKQIIIDALDLGIKELTLYTFSSENWKRPKDEVDILLDLLKSYLLSEIDFLIENNIRLNVIGNSDNISKKLGDNIQEACKKTESNNKMTLNIAFSYGGREEIIHACKKAIEANDSEISEENFSRYLYNPDMSDVDLLIRTSGVERVSNFLLWQIAYSELHFTDTLWPDFNKSDLKKAIDDYYSRSRNFGARNN